MIGEYLNICETHVNDGSPGLRFSSAAARTTSTAAIARFTTARFCIKHIIVVKQSKQHFKC